MIEYVLLHAHACMPHGHMRMQAHVVGLPDVVGLQRRPPGLEHPQRARRHLRRAPLGRDLRRDARLLGMLAAERIMYD